MKGKWLVLVEGFPIPDLIGWGIDKPTALKIAKSWAESHPGQTAYIAPPVIGETAMCTTYVEWY